MKIWFIINSVCRRIFSRAFYREMIWRNCCCVYRSLKICWEIRWLPSNNTTLWNVVIEKKTCDKIIGRSLLLHTEMFTLMFKISEWVAFLIYFSCPRNTTSALIINSGEFYLTFMPPVFISPELEQALKIGAEKLTQNCWYIAA